MKWRFIKGRCHMFLTLKPKIAKLAKQHNNANIICLPSRFIKVEEAIKIIESFILEKFEGGRHERRIKKINENLY